MRTPKQSFGYGARSAIALQSAAGGGKSILPSTGAFCGSTPAPALPRKREREYTSGVAATQSNLPTLIQFLSRQPQRVAGLADGRHARLIRPCADGRTVAGTAAGVGAASGCYPKRAEADKTTVITRVAAVRVPALRAADTGKPAATPDVMCAAQRAGMETSNVTTALISFPVRRHRASRHPGGQREHCARKNKPSHHNLLRIPWTPRP
jgi:hypothetical protein